MFFDFKWALLTNSDRVIKKSNFVSQNLFLVDRVEKGLHFMNMRNLEPFSEKIICFWVSKYHITFW